MSRLKWNSNFLKRSKSSNRLKNQKRIGGDEGKMKKLLNTLFVTTQGSYLFKEGETVVIKADDEIRLRLPVHTLGGIVCFGQVSCSPFLMGFCAENGVAIRNG